MNLFDYFDDLGGGPERARWAARAPHRPDPRFDLMLVPRAAEWRREPAARAQLEAVAAEPWAEAVEALAQGPVWLRLADGWLEAAGAGLEGGEAAAPDAGPLDGRRYAVYFWGANTTKALHVGHLRNLAIGNALGAALERAGGRVERRSLICDVGRSMGEAMAGVVRSGRGNGGPGPGGAEKSDHFVGCCYAEYVAASRSDAPGDDGAEDSVARESALYGDEADRLIASVLRGEQAALELWSKTRAWVIAGQRKTLARLGISFDEVIFESDFLPEVAELTRLGLDEGRLVRRGDGMVAYPTGREEMEEMPLVRVDGLPTQHMRALAYWAAAPELEGVTSLQVCGNEWVAHVNCRRKLLDELAAAGDVVANSGNGYGSGGPPTHDVFHGMVARDREAITSSKEGAQLIDDLVEWIEAAIEADPRCAAVRCSHPEPERIAPQVALAYFLQHPGSKRVEFEPELLLVPEQSLGWDLARAQARAEEEGAAPAAAGRPGEQPDYRFAVVQSQMQRRHLRHAVADLDLLPLARHLSHFARWYRARDRSPAVARVARAVLAQGARDLGLEAA